LRLLSWWARHGITGWERRSAFRKISRRFDGFTGRATTADGLIMDYRIGDPVDTNIAVNGSFEPLLTSIIRELAGRFGCFVDVGCNIGYFTCLYAKHRQGARILAIDANPAMTERCQHHLALNGLSGPKVLNIGVGAAAGELVLVSPKNRPSQASFGNPLGNSSEPIRIAVDTLSAILERSGITTPEVVKIDIEGYEPALFAGLREEHVRGIKHLLFEYSPQHLERCGFTPANIWRHPWWREYDLNLVDEDARSVNPITPDQIPASGAMVWAKRKST
jgi:FkbM family methyltransferase